MIGREDTNTTVSTVFKDLCNDSKVLELSKSNFWIAISATYNGHNIIRENDSYFKMAITKYSYDGNNTNSSEISYSLWGNKFNYDFLLQSTAEVVSLKFLCRDYNNFELLADGFTENQKFFEITIKKSTNG